MNALYAFLFSIVTFAFSVLVFFNFNIANCLWDEDEDIQDDMGHMVNMIEERYGVHIDFDEEHDMHAWNVPCEGEDE